MGITDVPVMDPLPRSLLLTWTMRGQLSVAPHDVDVARYGDEPWRQPSASLRVLLLSANQLGCNARALLRGIQNLCF